MKKQAKPKQADELTRVVMAIPFRRTSRGNEFLLLKRLATRGAFWQPAGGKVEPTDKTLLDAAYRELFEESGIRKEEVLKVFDSIHFFRFDKHYLTGEPIPPIEVTAFGFEVKPDVKIHFSNNQESPEHEGFIWAPYEQSLGLLKWQNNKDALEKLNSLIKP